MRGSVLCRGKPFECAISIFCAFPNHFKDDFAASRLLSVYQFFLQKLWHSDSLYSFSKLLFFFQEMLFMKFHITFPPILKKDNMQSGLLLDTTYFKMK